jgi:hypothetical protein
MINLGSKISRPARDRAGLNSIIGNRVFGGCDIRNLGKDTDLIIVQVHVIGFNMVGGTNRFIHMPGQIHHIINLCFQIF